jgi:hypothetical protein
MVDWPQAVLLVGMDFTLKTMALVSHVTILASTAQAQAIAIAKPVMSQNISSMKLEQGIARNATMLTEPVRPQVAQTTNSKSTLTKTQ